jgi:hypothetical protein
MSQVATTSNPNDDYLEGAEAIAAHLSWPDPNRVYQMRHKRGSTCPIRKLPGVGIYAFKSELDAWRRDPSTLPGQARAGHEAAA